MRFRRRVSGLLAGCVLLAGCGSGDGAGSVVENASARRVRFVHVAWPGRPLSDEMDRRVFADPAVQRALGTREF